MTEMTSFMFLGFNDWNKIRLASAPESDRDQYDRSRSDHDEYYV